MTNAHFEMALIAINGNFVPVCLRQSFKQICLVLRNIVLQAREVRYLVLLAWPCITYPTYRMCVVCWFFTRKQPVNKKKPLDIEVVSFKLNFTLFAMGL
jgi:hypothetical protein